MNEIEKNERLVAAIAKQYENSGLTHEELIKAGSQGGDEAERYFLAIEAKEKERDNA